VFRGSATFCFLLSAFCFCGFAADKSGVSPNTISLPKGPGSIEGLGESFQPTLNTGTAKHAVAIKVSPGTAGHAPDLKLAYEGGGGNGPLGFGWQLPLEYIQRRTDHGIPTYGENVGLNRDDTFINDLKEELVPMTNGFWFCKNEGAFIRYRFLTNHWEATLPTGTRLEFGLTDDGRLQDTNSNPPHVFSWLLQRETDTHGNTILYSYSSFPGSSNLNQKYLTGISYGPGAPPWNNFHFVTFVYGDRPDWFEDCRSGFIVRTGKRLKSIVVGTQGPSLAGHLAGDFNNDGAADCLVRRYELGYADYAGTNSHWSLLESIQQVGADGTSRLPAATFGYAICNPPDLVSATNSILGGLNEPSLVMDSESVDLVDLNGDGLPDILRTYPSGGTQAAYLNRGEILTNGQRVIQWSAPVDLGGDPLTAGFWLAQASVHLADMDGDGLADLVVKADSDDVFYFSNQGAVSWGSRQAMSTQEAAPPAPFGVANVRTADLDFDKRTDLIRGDGLEYQIWFNQGGQQYSSKVTVSPGFAFDFSLASVQIADLNGDRVPDIARIWPTRVEVTAGLGYGRFADAITMDIPDQTLDDTQVQKAKLTDITGDGLADLVIERAAPGELWYWINLGNFHFSTRKVITGLPTGIGLNAVIRWADLNGNGTTDLIYADSASEPRLQTVDLGEVLNNGLAPNTLTRIENGIGRVTTIAYQPSTAFLLADAAAGQAWTNLMPNPVSVVATVTNADSLGHFYVTRFRYHDGYYDPGEKQFRGFARADQVDVGDATAPTLVTRSHFDTGRSFEPMKGKLLVLSAEQEDGRVFWPESNSWTIPPVTLYAGTNGSNVTYVHPTAKVRTISELGQGTERRLESEFTYDNYGNQTTNADYGIVVGADRSAFDDERVTVTEYAINTDAWLLRHPARQQLMDEHGVVISRVESFYDDETFSGNNPGLVTIGNLTLKREWINPGIPAAYVQSTRAKFEAYGNPITLLDPLASAPGGTVDLTRGHTRQLDYDPRFHAYPMTETIHIGNGSAPLVFQATYDEGFGTVTASFDFNTNQTTYGYDVFNRLSNMVKPYDTPDYPTVEYDYALAVKFPLPSGGEGQGEGVVNFIETRQRDKSEIRNPKSEMYLISRQFVDGLGRELMTKTEAEPGMDGAPPRVTIKGAILFNARQKPQAILNPCYSTLSGDLDTQLGFESVEASAWTGRFHENGQTVTLALTNAHRTLTTYDASLREVEIRNPDGSLRRTVHEPLLSKSFDENDCDPSSPYFNTPTVHYNDGLGRLVRVDESTRLNDDGTTAGGIKIWATCYEYNLNGQLTLITDSQGNGKSFEYDGLHRKTFMNDPDRGVMQLFYDEASNLTETRDAKNQSITYTYDGVNRMLTETYHDGQPLPPWRLATPNPQLSTNYSVLYHYDTAYASLDLGDTSTGRAQNVRGMLAWVEDLSGEEHISYDARSRIGWVVKRIPDSQRQSLVAPDAGLVSYRSGFEYDSAGRVARVVYPDNDEIRYGYNERSLVHQIAGGANGLTQDGLVIRSLSYLPSDQQAEINYGNGIRTCYSYDSRQRLKELSTVNSQLSTELVHFAYDFDGVSNIKRIEDRRPGSAVPEGDVRRNTQLFQYDDLYRLTHVQYSFNLPGQAIRNDGEVDYRYDRLGNMLAQTSTINQQEQGLPVANLGEMDSGGALGRWNRTGRSPTDPPGPHALTQIRNPKSEIRNYSYDANGNMLVIDGLTNAWDFKDRLVAVENSEMRAAYTYDYTDRRIIKRVAPKLTTDNRPLTTVYVSKWFEMRDHDAPTKYVWNGATRVARVSGSLSSNYRVQRLRVFPGWNLVSLAVTATNAISQLSAPNPQLIQAAFRWEPITLSWASVASAEALPCGTVLWLNVSTNAVLSVAGPYCEPTNRIVAAGGAFLPGAGLEAWNLKSAISKVQSGAASTYDTPATRWQTQLPLNLPGLSDLPAVISPGQGSFVRADADAHLEVPDSALRIRYYHQDHLGSSACMSDAAGAMVSQDTFHPFGQARSSWRAHGLDEYYGFAQKERDKETDLHYFEARFLRPSLGRFLRVDPLLEYVPPRILGVPQALNGYSYAQGNPLSWEDPSGAETVGELIERKGTEAVASGHSVAGAGWAFAQAAWSVFGAENVSKVTDNLISSRHDLTKTDVVMAGVEVASAVAGGRVLAKGAQFAKQGVKSAGAFVGRKMAERAERKAGFMVGERAREIMAKHYTVLRPEDRQFFQTFKAGAEEVVAAQNRAAGMANWLYEKARVSVKAGLDDLGDLNEIVPKGYIEKIPVAVKEGAKEAYEYVLRELPK
jgi:RHS repeat-associated protein